MSAITDENSAIEYSIGGRPQEDGATVETRKALDQFHRSQWRLLRAFPEDVPTYLAYREYAWRKSLPV
jgi:hypothetical protein